MNRVIEAPIVGEDVSELGEDPTLPDQLDAVRALASCDEPGVIRLLMSVAADRACRPELRDAALEALCRLEAPEAIELLGRALRDPGIPEPARVRCADALGEIGNFGALDDLEAAARRDPSGPIRERAWAAIANILMGRGDAPE